MTTHSVKTVRQKKKKRGGMMDWKKFKKRGVLHKAGG